MIVNVGIMVVEFVGLDENRIFFLEVFGQELVVIFGCCDDVFCVRFELGDVINEILNWLLMCKDVNVCVGSFLDLLFLVCSMKGLMLVSVLFM